MFFYGNSYFPNHKDEKGVTMNSTGSNKFWMVSAAFLCTLMLTAGEFHLKSSLTPGAISWNSGGSYVEDAAPSGSSDVVIVPAGLAAELRSDDVGSWSLVSSLSSVMVSSGAVFKVTALEDAVLGCGVRLNGGESGRLLKDGGGRLTLTAADAVAAGETGFYDDYNLNIDVA